MCTIGVLNLNLEKQRMIFCIEQQYMFINIPRLRLGLQSLGLAQKDSLLLLMI
jgi:hypothetical protein